MGKIVEVKKQKIKTEVFKTLALKSRFLKVAKKMVIQC